VSPIGGWLSVLVIDSPARTRGRNGLDSRMRSGSRAAGTPGRGTRPTGRTAARGLACTARRYSENRNRRSSRVRLWEKAGAQPALGRPISWAVTIVRSRAIDRIRSTQRQPRRASSRPRPGSGVWIGRKTRGSTNPGVFSCPPSDHLENTEPKRGDSLGRRVLETRAANAGPLGSLQLMAIDFLQCCPE
jgi:hypothetical protein